MASVLLVLLLSIVDAIDRGCFARAALLISRLIDNVDVELSVLPSSIMHVVNCGCCCWRNVAVIASIHL